MLLQDIFQVHSLLCEYDGLYILERYVTHATYINTTHVLCNSPQTLFSQFVNL